MGFVLAALFTGSLFTSGKQSAAAIFLKLMIADLMILFCGTVWLKFSFASSWRQAFLWGFFPFVLGESFKIILATAVYQKLQARVKAILH